MKRKRINVCLSAIVMGAILSIGFTSCKNDDGVEPPKSLSTIYRTNVADSIYKFEYVIGHIKEIDLVFCKYINIIEFTGGNYLKKYQIHSNDCVSKHIKWEADIWGTESNWNHWNDDWKYNRKRIEYLTYAADFKNKTFTFSNGDSYQYATNNEDKVISLTSKKGGVLYVVWDDIKP